MYQSCQHCDALSATLNQPGKYANLVETPDGYVCEATEWCLARVRFFQKPTLKEERIARSSLKLSAVA